MYLTFFPTDVDFAKNLQALREWRLNTRQFGNDFNVVIDGHAHSAKSAYVKGDDKTFEYGGNRVSVELVNQVSLYLKGYDFQTLTYIRFPLGSIIRPSSSAGIDIPGVCFSGDAEVVGYVVNDNNFCFRLKLIDDSIIEPRVDSIIHLLSRPL